MSRKMMFFGVLYFMQGAALAYVINFQKPYLFAQGVSKESIGFFTSLLLLPFVAKVLWGWISDRFPWPRWGGRKPYMILGLSFFVIGYGIAGFVPAGENFLLFALLSLVASMGLAMFDACADGWAIDVSSAQEFGSIQAAMVAGKSIGLILMSVAFGIAALRFGFAPIFFGLAGLACLVMFLIAQIPYRPLNGSKASVGDNWGAWCESRMVLLGLFGVTYSIASFGTDGLLTLHLSEVHSATLSGVGLFGALRGVGALLGAALYALLASSLGFKRSQYVALLALAAGCFLPLLPIPWEISAPLWGLAWAFQETSYVTVAMMFSRGARSATFFAIFMIFSNVGTAIGEALGAPMVPALGYNGVFALFAGLTLFCLFFVFWINPVDRSHSKPACN